MPQARRAERGPVAVSGLSRRPLWLQITAASVGAVIALTLIVVVLGPGTWRGRGWRTTPAVVVDVREQGDASIVVYRYDASFGRIGGQATLPGQSADALARDGITRQAPIDILVDPQDERASVPSFAIARERAGFIGAVTVVVAAWMAAIVALVVVRRRTRATGRHDPAPETIGEEASRGVVGGAPPIDGGHLSVDGTVLSIGALGRADSVDVDPRGLVVRPHDDAPRRIAWDDLHAINGSADRTTHVLRLQTDDGTRECELGQPRDRPIVTDADLDAAVGLLQFCRSFRAAREGLTSPLTLRRVIAATTSAAHRTHLPPSLAAARPDLPPDALAALTDVADRMVDAAGVRYCGGRTVRGYRVDADESTLATAREWLPPELVNVDDVSLRAVLDSAQGPLPPWPFDLLLG